MLNKWITGIVFVVIGLFLLGITNLNHLLTRVEQKLSVVVFLKPGLAPDLVADLTANIKILANVESLEYVSPDQALSDFTQDPSIARQVQVAGENPLPASFVIRVKDPSLQRVRPLVDRITVMPGVDEIKYGEQEATRIQNMALQLNMAKGGIGVLIYGICLLLLFYAYSFSLTAKDLLNKNKLYAEALLIYLGSFIFALALITAVFSIFIKPAERFIFFNNREIAKFALITLVVQLAAVQLSLFHPRVKEKQL
jgi:cell division transport system permease protein